MKLLVVIGCILFIVVLVGISKLPNGIFVSSLPPQDADALQLKELEEMNENLRDIRGLLEKVAENTRK